MERSQRRLVLALAALALGLCAQSAWIPEPGRGAARSWAAPDEFRPAPDLTALARLIGTPQNDLIEPGDTLLDVAYRHRLGFDRIARLNPDVHHWIPTPGTVVRLPTEHVLPDTPHLGLVINVPEMQLYDYTVGPEPEVFAIAIGDELDPSLLGEFRIGSKRERPAWRVPASIRAKKPELPPVVPPGPDNPLGDHWMTIGTSSYGIHGTNNPWSIGREATHGCIRLYNDEIARLFARTRPRTPVRLVYQTIKIGRRDSILYLEAHPDVYRREPETMDRVAATLQRVFQLGLAEFVDPLLVRRAIEQEQGQPTPIGSLRGAGHLRAP
ncbi:L,D-transpeptidase family protein [Myxococcota bacterium]|nr:L,D-transpeptidase family protein [Myxococcota bacterium]MCZ7617628.1 L,D-transpeptidase family protein [Myxococcota bacterium]